MSILSFLVLPLLLLPAAIVIVHVGIYLTDPYALRQYPGPFLAKFTHVWLAWIVAQGHRSEVIHELHSKYGQFVRISPSEISISDPDALGTIYNFTNGAQKSAFYDAFVVTNRVVFTMRDRGQHARKRKSMAPIFSPKSILEYVPYVRRHIGTLVAQWDRIYDGALRGLSGAEGEGWSSGRDRRVWINCHPWVNYFTFDVISDLAFGTPLGMLESGRDAAAIPTSTFNVGLPPNFKAQEPHPDLDMGVTYIPAIAALAARIDYTSVMGVLPLSLRPLAARLPWFRARAPTMRRFLAIPAAAVAQRQAAPLTDRADMLRRFQDSMDEEGQPLTYMQLTDDAQGLFVAGSDTTSNTLTAIIYHLAANLQTQTCLQEELDKHMAIRAESDSQSDDPVATAEQVKHLPYLEACIYEGLRILSTVALGLPRDVPKGGLTVCGHSFLAGTTLGVPTYTIHRDSSIWGTDADVYRPERWLVHNDANNEKEAIARMHKMMNAFSIGPHACIGRQLAILEMQLALATLFRRYHIVLADPAKPLETREGFMRKPLRCDVGIKRRIV